MLPICSVYGLHSTEDGVIRYIGQTKQELHERRQQHICEALHPSAGRTRCHRWIRKVLRDGYDLGITLIEADCPWDEAEKRWIAEYRQRHPNIMTNHSNGGCGYAGPRSEETRQKMRKPKAEAHRAKILAHLASPEMRRRMALGQRGNTRGQGAKNGNAILNDDIVRAILEKLQQGKTLVAIGKEYGVTKATIHKVKMGRAWRHVTGYSEPT